MVDFDLMQLLEEKSLSPFDLICSEITFSFRSSKHYDSDFFHYVRCFAGFYLPGKRTMKIMFEMQLQGKGSVEIVLLILSTA